MVENIGDKPLEQVIADSQDIVDDPGVIEKKNFTPNDKILINDNSTEKTKEEKLTVQKLGSDYKFQIKIPLDKDSAIKFVAHILTVGEEVKATCRAREISEEGLPLDRYGLFYINTIASLDVATDSMTIVQNNGVEKTIPHKFWEFFSSKPGMERIWDKIIGPYSREYQNIKNEIALSFDDLKNF